MRHLTCDPNLEVNGQAAQSLLENIRAEEIKPVLEKHGLSQIESDEWYLAQRLLNILNDLAEQPDFMSNLVAVGMKVAEKTILPPQIESLEQLLSMYDMAYQMNHRNGKAGRITAEQVEEQFYRVKLDDIYPDDLSYGSLYGLAKRLLPEGTDFSVRYDNILTTRDRGGEETVVHVQWG